VGVLAGPCRQDPDKWRGDPHAWRTFDWAQRCRYHRENAYLAPPSPARVVFIGDSITEAWRASDPELFANHTFVRNRPFLEHQVAHHIAESQLTLCRSLLPNPAVKSW